MDDGPVRAAIILPHEVHGESLARVKVSLQLPGAVVPIADQDALTSKGVKGPIHSKMVNSACKLTLCALKIIHLPVSERACSALKT